MKTLFSLSPLSQFNVKSLIGLNAPILGHLNLTLTKFSTGNTIKYRSFSTDNFRKLKLWNSYYFKINKSSFIFKEIVNDSINSFWKEISKIIKQDEHLITLFRIKTDDNIVLTLGQLQKLHFADKEYYINYVLDILSLKAEDYSNKNIVEIIISYGIRSGEIEKHVTLKEVVKNTLYQNYKHYKLPVSLDPFKYGKILYQDIKNNAFVVQIGQQTQAVIKCNTDNNYIEIMKEGRLVLTYIDKFIFNKRQSIQFIREIGHNIFYYNYNNKLILSTMKKTSRYIKSVIRTKLINNKFITLDIETKLIDNIHVPYLISYFDGKISKSFFLTDYGSPVEMIQDCILSLCRFKYNRHKIYIHNLANFDGIFLLKAISELGELKVLMNKEKLISFDLNFSPYLNSKNKIVLSFRDSYQILLASLSKLGKSFNVSTLKSKFPYRFINETDLNYCGEIPKLKYFDNMNLKDFISYCKNYFTNNTWSLKNEAIKYCINDCKSLYEIITKYNQLNFKNFNVNINEHPTLSSHAFRIFRTHFLKQNVIPMIYGNDFKILKTSYTGGATDMYIPTNKENELVYGYDVNSLYPFIMANFPMPVGNKTYFEGNIRKIDPNAFGFFYCKITTPSNLKHPVLQTHVQTKSGMRTVAALGKYEDLIFSPSMDNAIKLGYKFKIL